MSLATSYAAALFENTREKGADPVAIERELVGVKRLLQDHKELRVVLLSPAVSLVEKNAVIEAVSKAASLSLNAERFLALLAKKGRLGFLSEILVAHEELRAQSAGSSRGMVRSADPLSADELTELEAIMKKKLGRAVSLAVETDPSLIAGLSVTVGGVTYDGSVRAQLERAQAALIAG